VLSRPIADGNLLKLDQICPARNGIVIDAVEVGLVPKASPLQFGRPPGSVRAEAGDHFQEAVPVVAGASRWRRVCEDPARLRRHDVIEDALRRAWADAGDQLHDPETRDPITRVLYKSQHRQEILDVGGLEEFEPAQLEERDVPPRQFDLKRPL